MAINLNIIPKDSYLKYWMNGLEGIETPRSYLLLVAMSAVGHLLRRNTWFDQERWKVYPNLSIFLVGPSGIGKDTAIDEGVDLVQELNGNVLYGRTAEQMGITMVKAGEDPSCWLVPGPEATSFFGRKEYQQGKLEFWTDILSTKKKHDFSSRTDGKMTINGPTITMMLGSTASWLQKNMPEGALEGGFLPRFIVDNENEPAKHVPLVKYASTKRELDSRSRNMKSFYATIKDIVISYINFPRETTPRKEAIDFYTNWYHNRFNYFSPGIKEYANRSRDQLLRVALLSAILRGRNYISASDMQFAHKLIQYTASSLEEVIRPQSSEQRCQQSYIDLLRSKGNLPRYAVLNYLRKSYDYSTIQKAEAQLVQSKIVSKNKEGNQYLIKESV